MPGSLLSTLSIVAAPDTFLFQRHCDRLASLFAPQHMATHWRVERWTMDEFPLSSALFDDLVTQLYQADGFMRGTVRVGGVAVHPRDITAPLFAVFQPGSTVIPPASVVEFVRAAASTEKELAAYRGDIGVALQHVGPLVGDSAHRELWPRIWAWIDRVAR